MYSYPVIFSSLSQVSRQTAQSTTEVGSKPTKDFRLRVRESRAIRELVIKDLQQQKAADYRGATTGYWGKYIWKLDAELPGKHTLKLYGSLNSDQAAVLIRARTSHTHLKSYLERIEVEDSARCECGQEDETVAHVLHRCPRWLEARKGLKAEAENTWGDLSFILVTRDVTTG